MIQYNAPTPDSTPSATGNTYVAKDTNTEDIPLAHILEQDHEPKAPPPTPQASNAIQSKPENKKKSQKTVDGKDGNTVATECSIFDISDQQPPADSDSLQEETLTTHLPTSCPYCILTHNSLIKKCFFPNQTSNIHESCPLSLITSLEQKPSKSSIMTVNLTPTSHFHSVRIRPKTLLAL